MVGSRARARTIRRLVLRPRDSTTHSPPHAHTPTRPHASTTTHNPQNHNQPRSPPHPDKLKPTTTPHHTTLHAGSTRKLLQGWPEPPITVNTPSGPGVIRRYPVSVQNIVGGNIFLPNYVQRGRGSATKA